MTSRYHRLDRFLSNRLQISRSNLRLLLAAGQIHDGRDVRIDAMCSERAHEKDETETLRKTGVIWAI